MLARASTNSNLMLRARGMFGSASTTQAVSISETDLVDHRGIQGMIAAAKTAAAIIRKTQGVSLHQCAESVMAWCEEHSVNATQRTVHDMPALAAHSPFFSYSMSVCVFLVAVDFSE